MIQGDLRKLEVCDGEPVGYSLPVGDARISLDSALGKRIRLQFQGEIHCIACGRHTRKSYQQGYCFPCTQRLAACDLCVLRPERCHFEQGTCREPEWGIAHCMQPHVVYLANSSALKVGITRENQLPTRWIDQGAAQAIAVFRVQTRYLSGLLERVIGAHVSDRTDWRKMLRGPPPPLDLETERDRLLAVAERDIAAVRAAAKDGMVNFSEAPRPAGFSYPVREYPVKVRSLSLDKTGQVEGTLQGIKGQYLIFDTGVLNVRKFAGYHVSVDGL